MSKAKAGTTWRVLAWGPKGEKWDVHSAELDRKYQKQLKGLGITSSEDTEVLPPGYEFDELVIEDWFHLEQMNKNEWWMRIGETDIWVRVKKGKAEVVTIERGPEVKEFS